MAVGVTATVVLGYSTALVAVAITMPVAFGVIECAITYVINVVAFNYFIEGEIGEHTGAMKLRVS